MNHDEIREALEWAFGHLTEWAKREVLSNPDNPLGRILFPMRQTAIPSTGTEED